MKNLKLPWKLTEISLTKTGGKKWKKYFKK